MEGKMLVTWVDICQLSTLRIVKDAKETHNRFIYLSHTPRPYTAAFSSIRPSFIPLDAPLLSQPGIITPELENRCRPRTYNSFLSFVYHLSFAHFPETWDFASRATGGIFRHIKGALLC
jgi:hypothetical protein